VKRALKGSAMLGPLPPAMVTVKSGEKVNIITVAWTGMINTRPPKTYVSIRPSRYSYNIIKESGEFVINITPTSLVKAADFCGTYTGAKVDKFKECSLTAEKASVVNVPTIAESPISLECKVTDEIPLGSHCMFLADVVAVDVAEELFDVNDRIIMEKADPAAFMHGAYYSLGKKINNIGCGIKKKGKTPPKYAKKDPEKRTKKR